MSSAAVAIDTFKGLKVEGHAERGLKVEGHAERVGDK